MEKVIKPDDLFSIMEEKMRSAIPDYIKKLMLIQGFDSIVAIRKMTSDDIEYLETFAISDNYANKVPAGSDGKEFYGEYNVDRANFRIVRGQQKLITEMVEIAQSDFLRDMPKGIHSLSCIILIFYSLCTQ